MRNVIIRHLDRHEISEEEYTRHRIKYTIVLLTFNKGHFRSAKTLEVILI
jgi:hypothetical protein